MLSYGRADLPAWLAEKFFAAYVAYSHEPPPTYCPPTIIGIDDIRECAGRSDNDGHEDAHNKCRHTGNPRRGGMLVPRRDSVHRVITVGRYVRPRTHFGHCRSLSRLICLRSSPREDLERVLFTVTPVPAFSLPPQLAPTCS